MNLLKEYNGKTSATRVAFLILIISSVVVPIIGFILKADAIGVGALAAAYISGAVTLKTISKKMEKNA